MRSLPLLGSVFALLLAPPASAEVFTVSSQSSLESAVTAAQDGDTILVQDDADGAFINLAGKALNIVGDQGVQPRLAGVIVFGLEPDDQVVLRGLRIGPNLGSVIAGASLAVLDSEGAVLVEDCVIESAEARSEDVPNGPAGVLVRNSENVSITRSMLIGGAGTTAQEVVLPGLPFPIEVDAVGDGGPGLLVENGRAAVWDSSLLGGAGGRDMLDDGVDDPGGQGGPGLRTVGSSVWFEGGLAQGGTGGDGCATAADGCAGGAGADAAEGDLLRTRDATLDGGAGGELAGGGLGDTGPAATGGTLVAFPGAAASMAETGPLRNGQPGTLTLSGPPGAQAARFVAARLGFTQLGGLKGVLAMDFPLIGPALLGPIPPSGEIVVDFVTPPLAATGLDNLELVNQGVVLDADGLRFSSPTSFVHVGDAPSP